MFRRVVLIGALSLLPGVAAAQQPCTTDARRVVAEVYQRVLERGIDASAENAINQLNNRQVTVRQIVAGVARLPEHQQRFLNSDRRSAVTYLYRHVLGREPDPQGLNDHVNGGGNLADILTAMTSSSEYAANFGDYGVPGSSVRFCAPGEQPTFNSNNNNNNNRNNRRQMRFAGMDANNNGQIERNEWNGTRESFVVQDWNGDNVLSGDEVETGGRRGGRQAQTAAFTSWDAQTFATLDRNRDGRLAAAEWQYDTASFVSADRNGDGTLTRTEFLNQATTASSTATTSVDANEFTVLDRNRNGRIERNEWRDSADAFGWLDRNRDNVLSRAEVLGNQGARSRFEDLDADSNNRLTLSEWEGTRGAFNQSDANGDGVLSRQEFNRSGAVGTAGQ
jgi:Ca2+-binding EF-hand superfamily protein